MKLILLLLSAATVLFAAQGRADYQIIRRAFTRGYQAKRDVELELVSLFVLIRGMAIFGWLNQRPELERAEYSLWVKRTIFEQCAALEAASETET